MREVSTLVAFFGRNPPPCRTQDTVLEPGPHRICYTAASGVLLVRVPGPAEYSVTWSAWLAVGERTTSWWLDLSPEPVALTPPRREGR